MTIEERLEALERELAETKAGLAAMGSAQAQGTRKEIRANAFIVEDENGNGRAALLADKKHGPELILSDENGKAVWAAP